MSNAQELSFSVNDLSPESIAGIRKNLEMLQEYLAKGQQASLRMGKGKEIPLPDSLINLVFQALTKAAAGKRIIIVEEDDEVSPEKAAKFLHVSRPFLVKKLDAGEVPFHWVGTHRRILMSDLVEYKRERRERSQELLRQMREEAEDMGLYE
ncbi:MAG: helix-turn-helix domain-containing protein [Blastocatellia bacterium]